MKGCYEHYIVRVYRRGSDPAEGRSRLVGVLEDGEGRQRAFHSADELIAILGQGKEWRYDGPPGEFGSCHGRAPGWDTGPGRRQVRSGVAIACTPGFSSTDTGRCRYTRGDV